jgi:hypothetical protein
MPDDFLRDNASTFAQEIQDTLTRVLPGQHAMVSIANDSRYVVRPQGDNPKNQRIRLFVGGEHLADLGLQLYLGLDSSGAFLKTWKSNLAIHSVLDRTPLVRQEFDAAITTVPMAHWHVHADRGALSHLLARAHAIRPELVKKPHDLSSLHLPVGGERFRPCLEDFLEFLIRECGIDAITGWETAVREGRERWRQRQFRSTVRDLQNDAADVLRTHGWSVIAPANTVAAGTGVLHRW